ncbi:MAG: YraN family protein [Clostridia bacterium]|nr:YraN family protein [Clostridia bacterium]
MSSKSETGKRGEEIACRYMEAQGFRILHRNLRMGHVETDIICENGEYILFVEVKTRRATGAVTRYGSARDAVDVRKRENLVACAKEYLRAHKTEKKPRIDVIEVYLSREEGAQITWIKNILG